MLYGNTSVFDLFKALRVYQTKQLFRNDRTRMHRRNVQNHNLPVYTRFSVDIATFADCLLIGIRVEGIHIPVGRFPILVFVSGKYRTIQIIKEVVIIALGFERQIFFWRPNPRMCWDGCITHITVVELALWMLLLAKYNSGGETVRGVVRQHACNFRQNQPRIPVCLEMIKRCFCCDYIVLAILSDLIPHIFWNWLIPW